MPQVCWTATAGGEYWLDVDLAGHPFRVLLDTGLLDAREQIGFSIEQDAYDRIKQAGAFQSHQMHARLHAGGQISMTESGSLHAQLICPRTRALVGPVVAISVFRGVPGIPDRVGMAFFHHLKGCKVLWDLDKREWCIEHP